MNKTVCKRCHGDVTYYGETSNVWAHLALNLTHKLTAKGEEKRQSDALPAVTSDGNNGVINKQRY